MKSGLGSGYLDSLWSKGDVDDSGVLITETRAFLHGNVRRDQSCHGDVTRAFFVLNVCG